MEPNFVLMKLPGEQALEFIEILPFTPANRNNLIGWIAGRSDEPHYGKAIVYHFPETRLVDGPLQIEARIDQNAQLSGQLSLWNQQGSQVRARRPDRDSGRPRPALRRADLSAGPAQPDARAAASSCSRCRIGSPTARRSKRRSRRCSGRRRRRWPPRTHGVTPAAPPPLRRAPRRRAPPAPPSGDANALIQGAARDLADYQRLTAEGKLGEAGQRLEALKQKLEALADSGSVDISTVGHKDTEGTDCFGSSSRVLCVLRCCEPALSSGHPLGERNHVPVGILDRELPHPVELRHERHHDLHRRLQPIVQRVDAVDFDEERAGGADRLAAERRDIPSPRSRRR